MMNLSKQEILWIEKCKKHPEKYKIWVDNDMIFIEDLKSEETVFEFDKFGYDFVVQILNYIGCNANWV